jgi:endonuclease YncB( thermonuclease family)
MSDCWSRAVLLAACCLLASAAPASAWTGNVVHVTDGDTVVVWTGGRSVTVRLAAIDAPEDGQPGGGEAREALSRMVAGCSVTVDERDVDRYGRVIAHIAVDGLDAGEEMLRRGHAWHFTRYSDDARLAGLEQAARAARIGIWGTPDPTAPWDYRHPGSRPRVAAQPQGFLQNLADLTKATRQCTGRPRCGDLSSCDEAYFYLRQCGLHRLDGDGDGVPCERLCG